MIADLRVCFLGDSFVAGVGDPEHLGWVGRVAARTNRGGQPLTAYGLGVRRETSRDVLGRWRRECAPRLPAGSACGVVVSFGVNDTTHEGGAVRVPPPQSAAHLARLLEGVATAGWRVLVVGPPPVRDRQQAERILALDAVFGTVCADADVAYVSVVEALLDSRVWMHEVAGGDGAHPGAAGYQELADLVWPAWQAWLPGLAPSGA
ncbi:MAG: GDSL-type esterase/lipase family protein [Actinomycetota bacterium]|nr:GDSL-type esterase/lipase family protein [Actinomycetota bacterium]